LAIVGLIFLPNTAPAPLVFTPGEGWVYEPVGGDNKWRMTRAEDQAGVATAALEAGEYSMALKAARRTVKEWPLSDFAPDAQYVIGRALEGKKKDQKAFKAYQKLVETYPKSENYNEVLQRQFEIANRFLDGQWFKLWGYVPFFPNMEKTADLYRDIIQNGPYSAVAPQAQMSIGTAWEKKEDYPLAVKAYERAADRYYDRPAVAAEALYKAGLAYQKQVKTAEYDQGVADQAISGFTDFITLYPDD
jgi:outer membrane protein assembly factor BamD (BamD/ComL family)